MSRTKHHRHQNRQHCGEDMWSRRAGLGYYPRTAYVKQLTHSIERQENKDLIRKELATTNITDINS